MAFNSFGQILRAGGEIALSIAKGLGFDQSRIARLIERRIRPDSPETMRQLDTFTDSMIGAGKIITGLDPHSQIELPSIPVNPYLFGDDPAGRRAFFTGEFSIEGIDKFYRVDVELADITTPSDIFESLNEEALRRVHDSPRAFGISREEADKITAFHIIAGERKF